MARPGGPRSARRLRSGCVLLSARYQSAAICDPLGHKLLVQLLYTPQFRDALPKGIAAGRLTKPRELVFTAFEATRVVGSLCLKAQKPSWHQSLSFHRKQFARCGQFANRRRRALHPHRPLRRSGDTSPGPASLDQSPRSHPQRLSGPRTCPLD